MEKLLAKEGRFGCLPLLSALSNATFGSLQTTVQMFSGCGSSQSLIGQLEKVSLVASIHDLRLCPILRSNGYSVTLAVSIGLALNFYLEAMLYLAYIIRKVHIFVQLFIEIRSFMPGVQN